MPTSRLPSRLLPILFAAATLPAQISTPTPRKPRTPKPATPLFNTGIVLLDPAHGGSDPGATLAADTLEKDATLAFAKTLRTLLTARGFTVILTHESAATPVAPAPRPAPPADATPEQLAAFEALPPLPAFNPAANNPPPDTRAEQANRSHAGACILIHATSSGRGVHLFTSALAPSPALEPDPTLRPIIPWDSAQSASLPYSTRLASDLAGALAGARIPVLTARLSTRPIDSFTCPAVTVELAPPEKITGNSFTAADSAWQQRVAQTIAAALDTWRAHALPPAPVTAVPPLQPSPAPRTRKPPAPTGAPL